MDNDILIYNYLGLGDHFICSGAVRKIYSKESFNNFYLIIKERDSKNMEYLYKDLNIKFIKVQNDNEAHRIVKSFTGKKYHWWWEGYDLSKTQYHEEEIYASLGFENSTRYDYFYLKRDHTREDTVFNKIINNNPYTFIADDPKRRYNIDLQKIPNYNNNLKVIKSSQLLDYTLFDLLKVIEKAQDVHVIYSSFFILIDCLSLNKIYLHNSYLNKVNPIETYGKRMKNFLTSRNITHV